jgi:hypothetical protein
MKMPNLLSTSLLVLAVVTAWPVSAENKDPQN